MITYRVRKIKGSVVREKLARLQAIEFANVVRDGIRSRFNKSQNVDGTKMTPLKPETIQVKKKKGGIDPKKPLVFKGGTQKGIQAQAINQKEAIVVSTGNAKGYYGGSTSSQDVIGYQRIKGRDPFGVSDKDRKNIKKRIKELLVG